MLQYFLVGFFPRSLLSGTVERLEIIITTMKTRVILFVCLLKVFQRIQVIIQFFDKCALSPSEQHTNSHLAHNSFRPLLCSVFRIRPIEHGVQLQQKRIYTMLGKANEQGRKKTRKKRWWRHRQWVIEKRALDRYEHECRGELLS